MCVITDVTAKSIKIYLVLYGLHIIHSEGGRIGGKNRKRITPNYSK